MKKKLNEDKFIHEVIEIVLKGKGDLQKIGNGIADYLKKAKVKQSVIREFVEDLEYMAIAETEEDAAQIAYSIWWSVIDD